MAEVAEENWLDSWPNTMLEGDDDKADMTGLYVVINGVCEEEKEGESLNI